MNSNSAYILLEIKNPEVVAAAAAAVVVPIATLPHLEIRKCTLEAAVAVAVGHKSWM